MSSVVDSDTVVAEKPNTGSAKPGKIKEGLILLVNFSLKELVLEQRRK
jgi:hypothetical protein